MQKATDIDGMRLDFPPLPEVGFRPNEADVIGIVQVAEAVVTAWRL
jgi:hypothetical protein